MSRRWLLAAAPLALLLVYLLSWPVPIDPVAWTPPPNPGFQGPFATNDHLKDAILLPVGTGPEDIAFDHAGRPHTGLADGRVVRLGADGRVEQVVAQLGRPLGLVFHGRDLLVADAVRGLVRLRGDQAEVLADSAGGTRFGFTDDLDVARDGAVYFSDASSRFGLGDSALDYLEHRGHGRLLVRRPSGEVATLAAGLHFANGVSVTHDERSVLVCETGGYRVLRHWLDGPRRGKTEPFVEALPGFPDNVNRGPDGTYWLALVKPRTTTVDDLAPRPFVRKVLLRLPESWLPLPPRRGVVIQLDGDGKPLRTLQDPSGRVVVTSAMERDGFLWLGNFEGPHLARVKLP